MAEPKKSFRDRLSGFKLSALIPGRKRVFRFSLGFAIFLVVLAVSAELTSRPTFCTTCHYMDPYYRQWKTSSHAEVACVSCHPVRPVTVGVSAVRYVTNTHDLRPRAEVEDASCLQSGCHDTRLLNGASTFLGSIQFDHTSHLTRLRRGKR